LDYEGSAGNGEPEITMNDLGFELLAGAGFDTVLGSQNNDRIYLGQDGGVANGRTGKDNFFIEHGLNKIDGGFDDDTVTFDLSSGLTISKIENTTINLYDDSPQSSGTVFTSASASGVIAGVEKIIGTNFDDFVTMERSGYQASDVNEFDMRDGIDHFHVDFYNDVGR
jgi:hypothetical protein